MSPAELRAALAREDVRPIYVLESDDPPSRLELTQDFVGIVDDGLQAFNVATFHGRDATTADAREQTLAAILSAARTLPMMAPRRVIVVHDADALLTPRRAKEEPAAEAPAGKRRARALTAAEEFEAYVTAPEPLTTMVLDAAAFDRGRRITKLLLQHAVIVDGGSLDSVDDAAKWIRARLERDEMTMDAGAIKALVAATGLSLSKLRGEVDKLVLYAAGAGGITVDDVREVVTPIEEPGEDFALGKAIWNGDVRAALREVGAQFEAGAPPPMVLGQIRAAALRLRPDARARRALGRVLDADLAVKSSRGQPRHVIERLLVDVCGSGPGGTTVRRSWS